MSSDHDSGFVLAFCPGRPAGFSPYRLRDRTGEDVVEVNDFLDAEATRGLSVRSLRAYGYSLLNFWRWLDSRGRGFSEISDRDVLLDYVRFQRNAAVEPAPATINHRLTAVSCLYRFRTGSELPIESPSSSHPYHSSAASPTGYLYPARRRRGRWRVKTPRRVVVPLSRAEVRSFLASFSTWRDIALASLMLLSGLRSREVIELDLRDHDPDEGRLRVRGKGQKERTVPLPGEVLHFLGAYLELERPEKAARTLFVSLKGRRRGQPMTPAGLRSLFRHHRRSSGVRNANAHRLRHTFGSELAAAGISLPALMKLMGHTDIHTTMRYVEISPHDVWEEFRRVQASRAREHGTEGHQE